MSLSFALSPEQEEFRRDSVFFNQYTLLNPSTTPNYAERFGGFVARLRLARAG